MGYFTWEEDDAYREGKRDAEYGRESSFNHDRHAWGGPDRAYWDGVNEVKEEEERRQRYREEERQEEERQRQRYEHET